MNASATPSISDNTAQQRYEATLNGQVAGFAAYQLQGDTIRFSHTEVQPAFEGQGVGSALARHALDDARSRALKVVPACAFIADFIGKHADYAGLVKAGS